MKNSDPQELETPTPENDEGMIEVKK